MAKSKKVSQKVLDELSYTAKFNRKSEKKRLAKAQQGNRKKG